MTLLPLTVCISILNRDRRDYLFCCWDFNIFIFPERLKFFINLEHIRLRLIDIHRTKALFHFPYISLPCHVHCGVIRQTITVNDAGSGGVGKAKQRKTRVCHFTKHSLACLARKFINNALIFHPPTTTPQRQSCIVLIKAVEIARKKFSSHGGGAIFTQHAMSECLHWLSNWAIFDTHYHILKHSIIERSSKWGDWFFHLLVFAWMSNKFISLNKIKKKLMKILDIKNLIKFWPKKSDNTEILMISH